MITDYLLPLLTFSTIFERFNVFLPALGFSLKISLILLPIVGLILLLKRRLTFNPTFLFPFLALLILVEALTIFVSFDPVQSFQVVIFHVLMVALFYLITWSIKEERNLDLLVWGWGIAAAVVSLLGIWQFARYLGGWDPTLPFESLFSSAKTLVSVTFLQSFYGLASEEIILKLGLSEGLLRPSSTFIDVSTGASFVGIFLILGLSWFLSWNRSDFRRVAMGALIIFPSIYFLMATSRSASLGLLIGLGVFSYLFLRDKSGKIKLLLITAAFLVLSAGILFTIESQPRLASTLSRLGYAQAAFEMVGRNPLLGIGVGNFEPFCLSILKPGETNCYSHSIFLTWVGESGLLGLMSNATLISVVVFFLWRIIRRLKHSSLWYTRLSGLLGAVVALVFANIFHAHYGLDFTWVLLGMVVAGYYQAKMSDVRSKMQDVAKGKLDVLGVGVDNVTMEEAVEKVRSFFRNQTSDIRRQFYVVTPNPEMVIQARKNAEFKETLNNADLSIPDGIGLIWASRVWGTPLVRQVSGVDLMEELCAESARRGGRVFLLGAAPGVAEKAAQVLERKYPKLKIAGTFAGDGTPAGDEETVAVIRKSGNQVTRGTSYPVTKLPSYPIDLLFVAYGHGKQERWVKRNLEKVPVKVALGVGGSFDYISGTVLRAPWLLRRLGLEWFYRLLKQPWRIKRQLSLFKFIILTFRESFVRI